MPEQDDELNILLHRASREAGEEFLRLMDKWHPESVSAVTSGDLLASGFRSAVMSAALHADAMRTMRASAFDEAAIRQIAKHARVMGAGMVDITIRKLEHDGEAPAPE